MSSIHLSSTMRCSGNHSGNPLTGDTTYSFPIPGAGVLDSYNILSSPSFYGRASRGVAPVSIVGEPCLGDRYNGLSSPSFGTPSSLSCSHTLYLLSDGLAHLSRRRRTSEIGCAHLPSCQNLFDGAHE